MPKGLRWALTAQAALEPDSESEAWGVQMRGSCLVCLFVCVLVVAKPGNCGWPRAGVAVVGAALGGPVLPHAPALGQEPARGDENDRQDPQGAPARRLHLLRTARPHAQHGTQSQDPSSGLYLVM